MLRVNPGALLIGMIYHLLAIEKRRVHELTGNHNDYKAFDFTE